MDLLESMIDSAIEKQELPEEVKDLQKEKHEGKDGNQADDEPQVRLFSY